MVEIRVSKAVIKRQRYRYVREEVERERARLARRYSAQATSRPKSRYPVTVHAVRVAPCHLCSVSSWSLHVVAVVTSGNGS